jgi:hypothetical protein
VVKENQKYIFDTRVEWIKANMGADKFTEYRWIKPEDLPAGIKNFSGEINTYENKVMMSLFSNNIPSGIMIESESLAGILKVLHALAWKGAEPVTTKTSKKKQTKKSR